MKKILVLVLMVIFSYAVNAAVEGGAELIGWAYEATGNPSGVVIVTYNYTSLLPYIPDENRLDLFYWENDTKTWRALNAVLNVEANTLTIEESEFPKIYVLGIKNETEVVCTDEDGDGFAVEGGECGPVDCDDSNANINPDAEEICNNIDDNCNGEVDEGVKNTYYLDNDNDGFGNPEVTIEACDAPEGYVEDNTDCDDSNANINPDAEEVCNGVDDNCDGVIDDVDEDNDGVNDCTEDKCLGTIEEAAWKRLIVRHYADIDNDGVFETRKRIFGPIVDSGITLVDTYGCSCSQILEHLPGRNRGQYAFGCSRGVINAWIKQKAWWTK